MPPVKKKTITAVEEQRNLTTFFSLRDVGYMVVTGIMVASAFFTFGTRISVLEKSEQVTTAAIVEIKQENDDLEVIINTLNGALGILSSEEDRLILDVHKIEERLRQLEVKGGAKK